MMTRLRVFFASALVVSLVACGGGGGSAGTPSSGAGSGSAIKKTPTLTVVVNDSTGATTNSVTGSGIATAKATLLDANKAPIPGIKVQFAAEDDLVKFTPATSALTNAAGVATVQMVSASITSAGAGTLSATANVNGDSVSGNRDFQVAAVDLSLGVLDLGTTPLAAFGNRPVSVVVSANGKPVSNTQVQVNFTASCGKIDPSSVSTDASGRASTTYSADDAKCSGGNVTITASTTGATPLVGSINVLAAEATNVQFVSATPALIYLSNSGGATQSQVKFKVVDSTGGPLQNQALQLSLVNAGPGISLNTVGNSAPVTLTTDAAGFVTVPVFSGTVPTSAQVRAVAVNNANLVATSNTLTVASGRPVQQAMSVSLEKFSIEGFNVDGTTSDVTVSLADRQGNPVPDGTEVNLVAQTGVLIPARCVITNGASQCSVKIRSQGTRTQNGRVQILAYVPGEENFIDANFNNVYDPGETFSDLGNAYRDDNENGQYDLGEFTVPRAGSALCGGGVNGRANTCDGQWGTVDVREQVTIVFATSQATFTSAVVGAGNSSIDTIVSDLNGNSMPTGTTLSAEALGGGGSGASCSVKKVTPGAIPNTYGPFAVHVNLENCEGGGTVLITATSPGKVSTTISISLPSLSTTTTSGTTSGTGSGSGSGSGTGSPFVLGA